MAQILSHDGYRVAHARDGAAALAAAGEEAPDLVLMDLGLPDLDGWEAAKRLRALPGLSALPIVALSGSVRSSDRARARAEGFAGFIEKPFRLDAFRREVRRHLGGSARR
jgi:CheY-like chemotaxis protein